MIPGMILLFILAFVQWVLMICVALPVLAAHILESHLLGSRQVWNTWHNFLQWLTMLNDKMTAQLVDR